LLGIAGTLLCLSLPLFPIDLQAYGNNLAATVVLGAGLVWHLLNPPAAATSQSATLLGAPEPGPNARPDKMVDRNRPVLMHRARGGGS
jgi:hypothetical protein